MKLISTVVALCLLAHAAEAETAKGADGVAIHYDRAGQGKPALVFVHGWSCDRSFWSNQFDAFAGQYTVVRIDLAGHGDSGTDRDDFSIKSFGADVASVVVAEELYDVVLIGHSMGGSVVVDAARRLGDRVSLVVAVDALQETGLKPMSKKESEKLWSPFREDFRTLTSGFVRAELFLPSSPPDLVNQVATDMASADPVIALKAGNGLTTWNHKKGIKAIRNTPLVLINSDYRPTDRDAITDLHPGARVSIVSGTGHFPMMEDPATFNNTLGVILEVAVADRY